MDYLNLARPAFYLYCNCKPCSFEDFFSEVMNIKEMKSSKNTQYLSILLTKFAQRCLLLFKVFRKLISNHTVHVMFWWSRMRSSILKKCWIPFWHGFESHNVNDVQWLLNFWICLKTDSRPPRSSKPHSYTFPITSLPTIWSHVPNVCLETTAAIECLIAIPGLHACIILLTLHCPQVGERWVRCKCSKSGDHAPTKLSQYCNVYIW